MSDFSPVNPLQQRLRTLGDDPSFLLTTKLQVTVLDAVQAILRLIRVSVPSTARHPVIAALHVLEPRRVRTKPEVLAKCVELLLQSIAENAK